MIREDIHKGFTSTIYNYVGMLFEKLVTLLVTIYVIRALPIADFGVYNLFQDTISLVAVIFSFGIPSLVERFLPELYERGLFDDLKKWVKRALIAKFILGSSAALLCIFGRKYLGSFLNSSDFAALFPIFAIGLVFSVLNQTAQTILDTFLLQRRRNIIRIIVSILRAGFYSMVLAMDLGLVGILWAFSISALIATMLFVWTIVKVKYPENVVQRVEGLGQLNERFKRYGVLSYFNEVGGVILSRRVDNYLISAYLNPAAAGLYSFSAKIIEMLMALTPLRVGNLIISTILFRQFTEDPSQEFLQRRFDLLTKLSLYMTLPFLVILLGLRHEIIQIIDARYIEAANILVVMVVFEVLNCFSYPIAWMAQSTEKIQVQLYSKIGAIYNIGSAMILIPKFGPIGAAWATGTSFLLKNLLMFVFLRKYLALSFPYLALVKQGIAGVFAWLTIELLIKSLSGWAAVMVLGGIGMLVFIFITKHLNSFDESEKSSLKKVFSRFSFFI